MAKGSIAKEEIWAKIKTCFDGAFECNGGKELRIPWVENGEQVQIKIAMTCAKENIVNSSNSVSEEAPVAQTEHYEVPRNKEEMADLAELMERLHLV